MKPEIDANGVQIQTFEEIFDELVAEYQAIYGSDINVDIDSPDGQRIAIEAKIQLDMQTYGAIIFSEMDPDLADGLSLERLVKFSGIERRPASKSQADIEAVASQNRTLPIGFKIEDDIGQIWETTQEVNLTVGVNLFTVFSENFGAVEAPAGTITEPVTIIPGITSVTNPAAATVGKDEETDPELRRRRILSLRNPATSTIGGIFSVLGNLPNVTGLQVYENDTDLFDSELNLNPHSIWIVIEGGDVNAIAEAVVKNKTAGTGLKGNTVAQYQEVIELSNGLTFDNTTDVEFDRPSVIELFVKADITTTNGTTPNETVIKQALASKFYNIGQDAVVSELYCEIYGSQRNLVATNLEISTDGVSYTEDVIEANPEWLFSIDVNNIALNIS